MTLPPLSPSPPHDTPTKEKSASPLFLRSSKILKILYSTLVAPCIEAPKLAMTRASIFISLAAVSAAIKKPGKDPLDPIAIVSPSFSPAS